VRRTLDIICSAAGLVLLSPLFALIAVAIKVDDGGPVFFTQRRVGLGLCPFILYKFRSMVQGADRFALLTVQKDVRLTRVGRVLRKAKLDELPQLANVLKGDMRFVGPRPEVERYVRMFPSEYARLLRERPGITDPASLVYRQEETFLSGNNVEGQYISHVLPDKLRISLAYQERRNTLSDLTVVLQTLFGGQPNLAGNEDIVKDNTAAS
jgi:lipopolysaccharide/colanic/teichoic acid biosynthesis glycosyltransferase